MNTKMGILKIVPMLLLVSIMMAAPELANSATFGHVTKIAAQGVGDGGEGWYVWPDQMPSNPPIDCQNNRFLMGASTPMLQESISLLLLSWSMDVSVILIVDREQCVLGNYRLRAVRMNTPNP